MHDPLREPGWLAGRVATVRARRIAARGARAIAQAWPVRRARREAPEWWRGVGLVLLLVPALYAAWTAADALVDWWTADPDAWGPAWYPTDTLAAIRRDLWAWQGRLLPAMLLATILGGAGLLLWESSRLWGRGWERGAAWPVATDAWVGACAWLAAVACPPAFAVALRAVASAFG